MHYQRFRTFYSMLKSAIVAPRAFLMLYKTREMGQRDGEKWHDEANLLEDWDERTIMIAQLIPENSDVLEFGAGRRVLEQNLPANCSYQASDIVERGENTLVCNLNEELPVLPRVYSHTVFSGVLEYVLDIDGLLRHLNNYTDNIIASYTTYEKLSDYITRKHNERRGWVNSYKDTEIFNMFEKNGFELIEKYFWREQTIYVFRKRTVG